MKGIHRHNELIESLRISPAVLSDRLSTLVNNGILDKVPYTERPTRYDYVLTDAGHDLEMVVLALDHWGYEHLESAEEKAPHDTTPATRRAILRWFEIPHVRAN